MSLQWSVVGERTAVRMSDDIEIQIHIDIRPMEVTRRNLDHMEDVFRRGLSKPREQVVVKKILAIVISQPNAVRGKLYYLNRRSDGSRHLLPVQSD